MKTVLYGYRHCFIVYIKTDDTYKDFAEVMKLDLTLQIMNQTTTKRKK